jgi:RimJ/RimL family protein N-acetyltransferase
VEIDLGSFVVRSHRPEDAPSLAAAANNPKVAANLRDRFPHPYLENDARDYIENPANADPEVQFAIARGANVLGGIGFHLQDDVSRLCAELGFFLGEPYRRQGITTAAIRAAVAHAFDTLDIVRVYAQVFEHNPASARVLEKCGFRLEGTLRRAVIKADKIMDLHLYPKLKDEPV